MKKLFENAISNIEELLKLRVLQISLLNQLERTKEATAINFKIKYYNVWIKLLKDCIKKNIDVKNKDDIVNLKLTKSLEHNLIELYETGEMQDIIDTKTELQNLETLLSKTKPESQSLFNSMTSDIDDTTDDIPTTHILHKGKTPKQKTHIDMFFI